MTDIPNYETFIKIELITKGMSGDEKYYIETDTGNKFLLRLTDITEYDRKAKEFQMVKAAASAGIPMPKPVDFGICSNGKQVYTLLTWIEGEEAEKILPLLSEKEQYSYGVKAGKALNKIHTIPAPNGLSSWFERYFAVIDERINAFHAEGIAFEGDSNILNYLQQNKSSLINRPQCFQHGDFHEGNLIITPEKEIYVIDWHGMDFDNFGDPWYELARGDEKYPYYMSGLINGYFNGKPPETFWTLYSYYLSCSAITSIVWAKYCAPNELENILKLNNYVLRWFENMQRVIPTWYIPD